MAPTRRRSDAGSLSGADEAEEDRSPKAHRLSNGSRVSMGSVASSSPSPSRSLDDSTHGSVTASTSTGASSSTHDHEEDVDGDVGEGVVGGHFVDEHGGGEEEEEEDQQVAHVQRPGSKGKGKRRAADVDDMAPEEDQDHEEEAADKENRRSVPVGGVGGEEPNTNTNTVDVDTRAGDAAAAAAGQSEEASSPITETGRTEDRRRSSNKKTKKRKKSNAEVGVVQEVYMENFMCHRKLTVPLGRRLNFISGRNGSGKSAILAALQICLGAKALLTHRAKKMADFIRHGWKGDAVVEVTLLNNEHGFKFNKYGKSITVRRTIKQPSGGGFELRGLDDEVKSTDRAELFSMLDELNIQVDNPVAVLDQENSKQFLQGSEHDKYAFFMRAVNLDLIFANIDSTAGEITKMRNASHKAVDQFPLHQAVVDQLRAELKEHHALEFLQKRIWTIAERVTWATVEEAEEVRDNVTQKLQVKTLEIEKLNEKREGSESRLATLEGDKDEIKGRLSASVADTARLQKEVQDAVKERKGAQQPLLALKDQCSKLEEEENEKKAAKEEAAKKLKAARGRARERALDDEEKALLDNIQRVEDSLADVARAKAGRGGEGRILDLRAAVQAAQAGADNATADFNSANQDLTVRRADLQALENGGFDPLTAVAPFMPALCRRITKEVAQFESPPVGPLGACIQLKEEYEEFRVCIEGHLSKNLANFVVGSHRDKSKLMALMKDFRRGGSRNRPLPTIIVQPRQARYMPPQNPPGCLQIVQAINVTDNQAFNALVDQCSIEKHCLFASKEEAERACLRGASGSFERMPHGMYEAYYPSQGGRNCNKFNVSDGNLQTRINVVNVKKHRRVLGVDHETQLQEARARVEQATAVVVQARDAANLALADRNRATAALEQEEAERDQLETREKKLGKEKDTLSTELLKLQAKKSGVTDPTEELQRELGVATEELEEIVEQLESLKGKIAEVSASIDPLKKAEDNAKKAHKESSEAAGEISQELEDGAAEESKHRSIVTRAQAALAELDKELEEMSTRHKEVEDQAEREEAKAKKVMKNLRVLQGKEWDEQRVTPGESVETLRLKLTKSKERLAKEKQERNLKTKSVAKVTEQLAEAMKHRDAMKGLADKLAVNMKKLSHERLKRLDKWIALREFASTNLSYRFNDYLMKRGASGEVRLDHDNMTMGMTYQKDSSNDDSQCDDVRQLSGGERSYATLAMLLAMGKSNECPFRVMDEFDVFMDAVSRNVAIKQLTEYAKLDNTRQFILLTPGDLSSVEPSRTCKVIKMKPPRKGDHNQTTLEESFGGGAS